MNRDDLLKKCADRGVADQGSIEAVSHLFYVYLLSALQKGQRVEVPDFGTFGTRVVGVKRARKMPYFEVEKDLADKVNDRYRDLRHLVVGRYNLIPVSGEEEYSGRETPYDSIVDQVGKEMIVDTHRDVTIEEYEQSLPVSQSKEKKTMPRLNLKDEGTEEDMRPLEEERTSTSNSAVNEMRESGGPAPWLQILIAVILLGGITAALNYFGIIHLWGDKAEQVVETLPEPDLLVETELPPPSGEVTEPPVELANPTPTPEITETVKPAPSSTGPSGQTPVKPAPAEPSPSTTVPKNTPTTPTPQKEIPKLSIPSSGSGQFTVQVSSWATQSKADAEVVKLTKAGLTAFVAEGAVGGGKWYRVRVGRYSTEKEAVAAAARLSEMLENGIWVARTSSQ